MFFFLLRNRFQMEMAVISLCERTFHRKCSTCKSRSLLPSQNALCEKISQYFPFTSAFLPLCVPTAWQTPTHSSAPSPSVTSSVKPSLSPSHSLLAGAQLLSLHVQGACTHPCHGFPSTISPPEAGVACGKELCLTHLGAPSCLTWNQEYRGW